MSQERRKVTVITGGSSGIGREAARLFARRGDTVVVIARRADRLQCLADELNKQGYNVHPFPLDLSIPEKAPAVIDNVLEQFQRLDILVNNAGFGQQALLERMAWKDVEKMFQVNVLSMIALCRAALPTMKKQRSGSIINVASVAGVSPHPLNTVYCSSKHAVVGFSRSLRLEVAGSGISVTVLCPGATQTEFFDVAQKEIPFPGWFAGKGIPAAQVAASILRESGRNRDLVYPAWNARLLGLIEKWLPFLSAYGNIKYRDLVMKRADRE